MYLDRNVTAEVSSMTVSLGKLLPREKAVRKDPAVHVSLSSDSLFKQPGPGEPESRRNPNAPENNRVLVHYSSEELQRHAIAPKGGG
jgi:hypothetical protein